MPKLRLKTKAEIDALPFEPKGQEHYWCTDLRGFGVVVGARAKTFVVQRDVKGKSRRVSIGRYGEMNLHEARRRAEELIGEMRGGVDPLAERRAAAANHMTLRDAWELYKGHLDAKERSPKTGDEYWKNLQRYCADWLDQPLADITPEDTNRRHKKIGTENGKYAANATMVALRAVWRRVRKQHRSLPETPTTNVDFYVERPRTAIIPYDKLPGWWKGVQSIENPIRRDLYIWLLFTGTRSAEARSLRWSQVDLDAATILFPKTKTGAFTLPLSDFLVDLLKTRKACETTQGEFGTDVEFVFPAWTRKRDKITYVAEAKLNEPEIKRFPCEWTPHTLRHTYVTMAENKVAIPDAHRRLLVNHAIPKSGDAHSGYNHPELSDLRRSQQAVTDAFRAGIEKQTV